MSKSKVMSLTMWFVVLLFYMYQSVIRVLPSALIPEIMEQLSIGADIFGHYAGIYYIGYNLSHIPLAIALDRFGVKKIIPICVILTAIGLLPIIYSDYWGFSIIGRMITGVGSSASVLGLFYIINNRFGQKHFTMVFGISATIGLLVTTYGSSIIYNLSLYGGWKNAIKTLFMLGILMAIICWIVLPKTTVVDNSKSVIEDLKEVLFNKKLILLCLFGGAMIGPLEGFADVWGTPFLSSVYSLEKSVSIQLPALIFTGMAIGLPLMGYIVDKTKKHYELAILSGVIMLVSFLYMLLGKVVENNLSTTMLVVGLFSSYQLIIVSLAGSIVRKKVSTLAITCANMIMMTFGYIFHVVIGNTIYKLWDGRMFNNVPLYNSEVFIYGLAIIPVGLTIGIIGFSFLKIRKY